MRKEFIDNLDANRMEPLAEYEQLNKPQELHSKIVELLNTPDESTRTLESDFVKKKKLYRWMT